MHKPNFKLLSLGIFIILMQNSLVAADKNGNTHLGLFNKTDGKNNYIVGTFNKTEGNKNSITGLPIQLKGMKIKL
ncbi:hypothetical protein CBG60_01250 [Fusobacterium animalis]|uniref:hypothetical protein n=1 Tax=Fusobacterium animalis TaxID=76859 RepID=UPI000B60163C|nr:hypothetical protein CBG60_01250 [Fusobacterium animalis]